MIKKFFIIILVFCCFFWSKVDSLAIFFSTYTSATEVYRTATDGISYKLVALSYCDDGDTTCNKGSSASDCGTNYGEVDCRTSSSGCCADSPTWTKSRSMCVSKTSYGRTTYQSAWGKTTSSCYLGDKVNDGDYRLIRAGNCECTSGGIYKACCSGGTLVNSYVRDVDGKGTLEADCYNSGDTIWAGGATIDLAWAIANCTPPCTKGEWSYAGACDQYQTCSNPSCGCNGTEITTPRTVGIPGTCGSANGQTYSTGNFTDLTNLCTSGDVQWTNGPNGASGCTWTWNCVGECGAAANCSATKLINGVSGVCGASAGDRLTTAPTTGLCTTGAASAVSIGTSTFTWTCAGTAGTCSGATGTTANCSAIRDNPPTYVSMVVQNTSGTTVAAEAGGRNQICDTNFSSDGTARFVVTFTDIQGGNDINSADLGFSYGSYNKTYSTTTFTVSGNNATATFNVPKSDISSTNILNIYARPYDDHSTITSAAADTARDFKFWNCNVPVSGTLYDGSAGIACPSTGFSMPATSTNFTRLMFSNGVGITIPMNIKTANTYGDGNPLVWGKNYTPYFNSDLAMLITTGGVRANTVCTSWAIDLRNGTIVDPYVVSPTLVADFSGAVDQDSWYQTLGGGLLANSRITNRVPVTCTTANCVMSINGTTTTNGIVASPNISNTGNSGINKGSPNNWWVTKPLVSTSKSDYTYFLNQYFYKDGVGTTLNGDKYFSDLGANPTGVYFINGNLSVTTDNTVPVGSFLMVVASGNITIQSNVNNLAGIFVSKNLNIGGSSATALTINGMIKATENVKAYRTFINKRTNNTAAAVNFVYRPDFVFNIPKEIGKQLVKWQWGN